MRAVLFDTKDMEFKLSERPVPEIGAEQVLVRLQAAAMNHRDLNMPPFYKVMKERNPEANFAPYTIGADGAGVIERVGENVKGWTAGDEVLFSSLFFCGTCPACLSGDNSVCMHGNIFGTSGYDGTMAEYVAVPAKLLIKKPAHLNFQETASLSMALGTAWRALKRGSFQPGETVLIQGIGGGVALFAPQLVAAMGGRAIVTSSSEEKLARAKELGAFAGINYKTENVADRVKELTGGLGADLVLDGGGQQTLPIAIQSVRGLGRIVNYGFVTGRNFDFDPFHLFIRQVSLIGTAMHTFDELASAVRFFETNNLRPVVSHAFSYEAALEAIETMQKGEQFGKIIVEFA